MASAAQNRRGIFAMLMAVVTFVVSDMLVRLAAATLPTGEIMAVRGIMATGIVFGMAAATGALREAGRFFQQVVLLRGGLEGVISIFFIAALPNLPFAVITSAMLAASLVATALAALLGIERVGPRRWLALMIGFAGVLVVLRPTPSDVTPAALLALTCTFLVGMRDVATRKIRAETPTILIALSSTVIVTVLGFALAGFEPGWRTPTPREAAFLAGAAVAVSCANVMIVTAFRVADVAVVAPFRYTSIVCAMIVGFVVWEESPDLWTVAGSLMIVGSSLYTMWRERVRARAIVAESAA